MVCESARSAISTRLDQRQSAGPAIIAGTMLVSDIDLFFVFLVIAAYTVAGYGGSKGNAGGVLTTRPKRPDKTEEK